MTSPESVLEFWFGDRSRPPGAIKAEKGKVWFGGGAEIDRVITERFTALLEDARAGRLEAWKTDPASTLALIITLDQFSRVIYRGRPEAFAQDPRALALSLSLLDAGLDSGLGLSERTFLLMPLMHAEDRDAQQRGEAEFQRLLDAAEGQDRAGFEAQLDYMRRHRAIVERFGRFPHRNAVLGRESTEEEEEFLTQPGSSF